jgi:thiamine-phosphate pyrophosphorylase
MNKLVNADHFKLMFITQGNSLDEITAEVNAYLNGGGRWVQLRMKDQPVELIETTAKFIGKLCDKAGATFIVNDHPQIALNQWVHGTHVGKNDMSVAEARSLLGNGKIIGATANSYEDVIDHLNQGADYVGIGPYRFTTTKRNLSPILNTQGYINIIQQLKENGKSIPCVAIGGITHDDIPELIRTGINGIAVSGAVSKSHDPTLATVKLLESLRNAFAHKQLTTEIQ